MDVLRATISAAAALALLAGTAVAESGGSDGGPAKGTAATGPLEGAGADGRAAKPSKKGAKERRAKGTTSPKGRSGTDSSFKDDSQGQTSGAAGVSPGTGASTHPSGSAADGSR